MLVLATHLCNPKPDAEYASMPAGTCKYRGSRMPRCALTGGQLSATYTKPEWQRCGAAPPRRPLLPLLLLRLAQQGQQEGLAPPPGLQEQQLEGAQGVELGQPMRTALQLQRPGLW